MAAVTDYAEIVETVLDAYTKIPYAHGELTCEAISDRSRGRFMLVTLGWDDEERVHHPLAHIDMIDGKLWIQADNTEHGLAPEEVESALFDENTTFDVSDSSGRPIAFGNTVTGRFIAVVFEVLNPDDPLILRPVTADDVPEPTE